MTHSLMPTSLFSPVLLSGLEPSRPHSSTSGPKRSYAKRVLGLESVSYARRSVMNTSSWFGSDERSG